MDAIVQIASTLTDRVSTNLRGSFLDMTPERLVRIVIIAGTYLLLRPYLIKLGGQAQMQSQGGDVATLARQERETPPQFDVVMH